MEEGTSTTMVQLTAGPQNTQGLHGIITIPMHTSKGATQLDPKFTKC
jgi:hypothetical protein